MQNTTEWKSSVRCFETQVVLSLLVHLKCSFMEAFGKRLQKQESELTVIKVMIWQTIFYPLSLPDILVMSYEMLNSCPEILSSSHMNTLCPGCVPQLPEDHPGNLSTVLNLLWENRKSESANCTTDGPRVCWEHLPLLPTVSKEPPCCFTLGGEVTAQFGLARSSHTNQGDGPNTTHELVSRQCSQLQGWILQVDSGKVLNSAFNED